MFKDLDPLLHAQLRLMIVSHLISNGESSFKELKTVTKATPGNMSVQLKKLETAEYLKIQKSFLDNYPHTSVTLTKKGVKAFENYVIALKQYIK